MKPVLTHPQIAAWVLAVAGPALLTLGSLPLHSPLVLGGFLFCMLLVVIATAVIGGTLPALAGVFQLGPAAGNRMRESASSRWPSGPRWLHALPDVHEPGAPRPYLPGR